jgi:hypothetical protein
VFAATAPGCRLPDRRFDSDGMIVDASQHIFDGQKLVETPI